MILIHAAVPLFAMVVSVLADGVLPFFAAAGPIEIPVLARTNGMIAVRSFSSKGTDSFYETSSRHRLRMAQFEATWQCTQLQKEERRLLVGT
jgi:hypothetical protein